MKPTLVIGLGNPLMGDDAAGPAVVDLLAADERLPEDAETLQAGTDLLRYADRMVGRRRVILVDSLSNREPPGEVFVYDGEFAGLEQRHREAHHLSLPGLVAILRTCSASHAEVDFVLFGVAIGPISPGSSLSVALTERLPGIVNELLAVLDR
jgi:hydrogenase maturation protease